MLWQEVQKQQQQKTYDMFLPIWYKGKTTSNDSWPKTLEIVLKCIKYQYGKQKLNSWFFDMCIFKPERKVRAQLWCHSDLLKEKRNQKKIFLFLHVCEVQTRGHPYKIQVDLRYISGIKFCALSHSDGLNVLDVEKLTQKLSIHLAIITVQNKPDFLLETKQLKKIQQLSEIC